MWRTNKTETETESSKLLFPASVLQGFKCSFFSGRVCRKVYTFTRVPQYEYIGEANEELTDVRTLDECRNLCLETTLYECRY